VSSEQAEASQAKRFSLLVLVMASVLFFLIGLMTGVLTSPSVKAFLGLLEPESNVTTNTSQGDSSEADDAERQQSLFVPMEGVFSPDKERFYAEVGEFLVAIKYQGRTRYLQLTVQLVGHDEEYMETVEKDVPAIRNGLSIYFAQQDFAAISTLEGRETLRVSTLGEVNTIIGATPESRVADVFFTEYITQ
jgi:flagellar FliL protein